MKQIAIIGLGSFGKRVLEELVRLDCEIILVDRDSGLVNFYRDRVSEAYIADVANEETVQMLISADLDSVVLDLGDRIETSILASNYLKKKGIRNIVVKAESDPHGEILELVGADHVVYPDRDAARRITPMIVTELLFNFTPIGRGLVMAEIGVPSGYAGQTLVQADLRKKFSINVVAVRKDKGGDFVFIPPDYTMTEGDILLVAGAETDVMRFAGVAEVVRKKGKNGYLKKLFGKNNPES